jgi:hypothetical protein
VLNRKGAVAAAGTFLALNLVLLRAGCSTTETTTPTTAPTTSTAVSEERDRVLVRGRATLDGEAFDARFLGAVVRWHGLVTPCQGTIPPVEGGRYEITVLAGTEGTGCGAPGAEVVLWTFADDQKLYSNEALAWPGNGRTTSFDPSFSTAAPRGSAPEVTEFSGEVFDGDGRRLPSGTRVEAYVDGTRCAIASVRGTDDFLGYILNVVGPDSIAGCIRDATLTFRVNGVPTAETAVNDLTAGGPGSGGSFDLTLQHT